ncbi:adenylate/guanylate cyclase domain-containing protein [Zunongwangia profunda]|uniref:adenylate/guanylate cyclase domain-containing protein n=1 Tax=Zunongwangia profunda TaxID=398743 RepID=UPI00248D44F0|nr:adenylate/guanylate cyclase domain-containing protein [Zunongwangia profunda]
MRLKNRYRLADFLTTLFIWLLSLFILSLVKLQDLNDQYIKEIYENQNITKCNIYYLILILGLSFGSLFGLLNSLVYPQYIKSNSFIKNLLIRALFFLLVFFISYIILIVVYHSNFLISYKEKELPLDNSILIFLFITVLINAFCDFVLLVRKNIGPSYFWYLLKGKYIKPREEERIFMFLDLSSSTTIAEKIGHLKFSLMLQECFQKLSSIILDYEAEIYQFVGDEAVLTWKINQRSNLEDCVSLYFHFTQILIHHKDQFIKKYDCVPQFKASLHMGKVTMTLVGDIKTEIVFHGDVLNTAARIQSLCNLYKSHLLISNTFYSKLKKMENYNFHPIQNVSLTGKKQTTTIYNVILK